MERDGHHPWVVGVDRLDPVPVVDVEVDVEDAEALVPGGRDGQRDVVVDAEAGGPRRHRVVEPAARVIGMVDIAPDDRLDRAERAAGDRRRCLVHPLERRDVAERGDPERWRQARVGAEPADRRRGTRGRWTAQQLVVGRRLGRQTGLGADRAKEVDPGPKRRGVSGWDGPKS